MFFNGPNISDVPKHIRGAWTKEQRAFIEAVYSRQQLGPEWITAHRCVEMQCGSKKERDFLLGYYPEEALANLENFKQTHYAMAPDKGCSALSSVVLRVSKFYPEFFTVNIRPRLRPLEHTQDTHPYAFELYMRIKDLDDEYYRSLAAAEQLTRHISNRKERMAKLHDLFKLAFEAVYPGLKTILSELAASH